MKVTVVNKFNENLKVVKFNGVVVGTYKLDEIEEWQSDSDLVMAALDANTNIIFDVCPCEDIVVGLLGDTKVEISVGPKVDRANIIKDYSKFGVEVEFVDIG